MYIYAHTSFVLLRIRVIEIKTYYIESISFDFGRKIGSSYKWDISYETFAYPKVNMRSYIAIKKHQSVVKTKRLYYIYPLRSELKK